MVRQKVKGTGHKQPSDASSEPNFYAMPPVEPEYPNTTTWGARYKPTILPPMQESRAQAKPSQQQQQSQAPPVIDPNSPGFSSLHGAAQLLHGISSGGRGGAFLGPPATGSATSSSSSGQPTRQFKPASFLQPSQLPDPDKQAQV